MKYADPPFSVVTCRGSTEAKDYEKLLLHYFDGDPKIWSIDHLDMFVHTASGWLHKQKSLASSEDVTKILGKMMQAGDALLQRTSRHVYSIRHANDEEWLYGLSVHTHNELSPAHRPPLRTLLHTFEKLFLRDALFGDQSRMSAYLHDGLQTLHNDITKCKDEHCRWTSHRCDASEDYLDCPLLKKPGSANVGPVSSDSYEAMTSQEESLLFGDWGTSDERLLPSISRAQSGTSDGQAGSSSLNSRVLLFDSPSQSISAAYPSPWISQSPTPLYESPVTSRAGTRPVEPSSPPIRAACLALQESGDTLDSDDLTPGRAEAGSLLMRDAARLFPSTGLPPGDVFSTRYHYEMRPLDEAQDPDTGGE